MEQIKIEHLTKDYGKGKGIYDISFTVKKGEIFWFCVPNCSVKPTTIRILIGFITADKVRVYELIEKAQETVRLLELDGSWGVHGFKYSTQRIDAAVAYIEEAQRIINKK